MKKKLFAIAALVVVLAMTATGTLAYFTAKTVAHNVITSGEIDIELVETMKTDKGEVAYPSDGVTGIMPGQDVSKIVNVKNVGSNDAWVRVKVTKSVTATDGEGKKVTLPDDVLTLKFDETKKWIDGGDGYYYYNAILTPDATTSVPLFTGVHFDGAGMGNAYQNARIEIDVQVYATQVANNGATVLEAKGWPVDFAAALFG